MFKHYTEYTVNAKQENKYFFEDIIYHIITGYYFIKRAYKIYQWFAFYFYFSE